MKFIKTILISLIAITLVASCVKDLDPQSLGPFSPTSVTVYKTTADYKSGLAKIYASYGLSGQSGPADLDLTGFDAGFSVYLRSYWNLQELSTDEAVYTYSEGGANFPIHWQNWTATNSVVSIVYYRIMLTISYCNEFIRASASSTDPDVKKFYAEARFLRALSYLHALDMYGYPAFVTEADKPGAFFPKQTNPAELFAYIDSELTAIEGDLGDPGFEYGRADKAALWMLQGKLYLNAQTYIHTDRYSECITAMNKIFAANKYSLATDYLWNFRADNDKSPEMIFAFNFDAGQSQSYGGMDYLIHGQIGGTMNPVDFGLISGGGWGLLRVTSALVDKFPNKDNRDQFYTDGQNLEIKSFASFTDGYAVTKFKNITLAGGPAPSGGNAGFVDTDFPVFRLADAYLMYAESVVRGGVGGSLSQALTYVNAIRQRAYGDASGNITSVELTSPYFILDERAREFYWEGHRRTDLVRYGVFTGDTYLWPWKGNVNVGAGTEAFRNLFPIPAAELAANPSMKQVVSGY